jgi:hypothetical protein
LAQYGSAHATRLAAGRCATDGTTGLPHSIQYSHEHAHVTIASPAAAQATAAVALSHIETAVLDLAIPYAAAIVMMLIESLVETVGWQMRMVRAGWDLCVPGLGAGGIFASPAMIHAWGADAVTWAVVSWFVSILCGLIIMHIRKGAKTRATGWRGLASFMLGSIAVVLPVYFALHTGG